MIGANDTHAAHEGTARLSWAYATFAALAALVCVGFTASASWALLLFFAASGATAGGPSLPRLAMKAAAFSLVFAASVAWLIALYRRRPAFRIDEPCPTRRLRRADLAWLIATVTLVALASGVRLRTYPHIEPDESHHLIVARNIAAHGVYGSGMPATGFRRFDDYDSVGPTVLLPVAAAIAAIGEPLLAGRLAMAAFYVLLTIAVYCFMASASRPSAAATAAAFVLLTPGSLYLARTLYGEAPALAFLIAASFVWGRSLHAPRPLAWCAAAGMLFGCALVTKYFLVVAAWPALGMWVYDAMTYRRIRAVHAVVPAGVALAALAAWIAITSAYGPQGGDTAAGHLSMYQHNLLFGLQSVDTALAWLARHWAAVLVCLVVGLLAAAGTAAHAAYAPSWIFLALFAVSNTYWWIFFTTGTIPRYVWYGLAIGAMFAGRACANGIANMHAARGNTKYLRPAIHVALTLLLVWDAAPRFDAMLTRDEMRDEYALIAHLERAYPNKALATTFYPIERIANLLAERPLTRVRVTDSWRAYDAVIVDTISQPDAAAKATAAIGRYAIVEPGTAAP